MCTHTLIFMPLCVCVCNSPNLYVSFKCNRFVSPWSSSNWKHMKYSPRLAILPSIHLTLPCFFSHSRNRSSRQTTATKLKLRFSFSFLSRGLLCCLIFISLTLPLSVLALLRLWVCAVCVKVRGHENGNSAQLASAAQLTLRQLRV